MVSCRGLERLGHPSVPRCAGRPVRTAGAGYKEQIRGRLWLDTSKDYVFASKLHRAPRSRDSRQWLPTMGSPSARLLVPEMPSPSLDLPMPRRACRPPSDHGTLESLQDVGCGGVNAAARALTTHAVLEYYQAND